MREPFFGDEDYVAWRLSKEIGLQLVKVEENPTTKTCDFRASDDRNVYWIEVKARTGDRGIIRAFRGEGVVHSGRPKPTGYSKRTASILGDAVRQLESLSDRDGREFEVAWLVIRSPLESDLHTEQAIATAYGTADILEAGKSQLKPCYFFGESVFFHHKQLDALVVEQPEGFLLCLNPYARPLASFQESSLFKYFKTRAVLDPVEEELEGRGYTAIGCPLDRRNEAAVLVFVRQKYGLREPRLVRIQDFRATATYRETPKERRRRLDESGPPGRSD